VSHSDNLTNQREAVTEKQLKYEIMRISWRYVSICIGQNINIYGDKYVKNKWVNSNLTFWA
jgi:hypothetical protein